MSLYIPLPGDLEAASIPTNIRSMANSLGDFISKRILNVDGINNNLFKASVNG